MGTNSQSRKSFELTNKKASTMKFAIVAAAGAGIASASMASLNNNVAALHRSQNSTNPRAFVGLIEQGFEPINGYGCWCYLDDTWRDANQVLINRPAILAHGQVVDGLDESCKSLINAYKCIEMDAEANGIEDCDAQSVVYNPFSYFTAQTTLEVECANTNTGECAVNACIAEGAFTLRYLEYMIQTKSITEDAEYNVAHVHASRNIAGGTFDPVVECPGIPNPVGSDKDCCGDHTLLSRKPFRLYSGFTTRSCCAGEVINNELLRCCANTNSIDINDSC